jgi:hypothetical protein
MNGDCAVQYLHRVAEYGGRQGCEEIIIETGCYSDIQENC